LGGQFEENGGIEDDRNFPMEFYVI